MERTALPGRLAWQLGRVVDIVDETPRCRSLVLDVPGWRGHTAGQHVDVRLTAVDGYQTQRSYSLASPPEARQITLTVERLDDGEVSPYLTEVLQEGDQLKLRGPNRRLLHLAGRRWRAAAAHGWRLGHRSADGHAPPSRCAAQQSASAPAVLVAGIRGDHLSPGAGATGRRRPDVNGEAHAHGPPAASME
ncbi:MAG TPA: FAD-binding oxidoreductase [Roseiflexaceae bacterium]